MSAQEGLLSEKSTTRTRVADFSLLKYASENRKEGLFDDIAVNVEKTTIRANRMVLASHSRFFETICKKNYSDGKCVNCIEIQGLNVEAVKAIIDYFYVETINITSQNVMDLLKVSNHLQVDDVKEFCYEFLESIVEPKNSIAILKSVEQSENIAFRNGIYRCISDHLDEVAQTVDFQALSKTDFVLCITEGTTATEAWKYQALISWTKYDVENRKQEFAELFQQLVDAKKVSIKLIEQVLLKEKLIRDNAACFEQVLNAFSQLLEHKRMSLLPPGQTTVISIGGENTPRKIQDVYNVHAKALFDHRDFPTDIHSHRSLKLEDFVLCIGGKKGLDFFHENLSDVWIFNLKQENPQWHKVASMNEKRSNMGAAVFQDRPVVAGGSSSATEYYEILTDEWKMICPMKEQRENCALVPCEGCLYAIGGKTGFFEAEIQSSVERLQSFNADWEDAVPMQTPRHLFAAVECNGMIYAIGGQFQADFSTTTKSVERYDPAANSWSFVKDMNIARHGHSACVLNGKIIVVGGKDASLTPASKIEEYDPTTDSWTIVGSISDDLFNHSLVVT